VPALRVPARGRVRLCVPASGRRLVPVRYVATGRQVALVASLPAGVVSSVADQAFSCHGG
jgi:hypothetical protein